MSNILQYIMKMKAVLNFIVLFCVVSIGSSKLTQVVSFFRHGARYPLNSIYDGNETRYIWGELTSVGMRQHQTLGQILRKEYIEKLGFLSSSFTEGEIEVYSTAINRTIQSAMSQLYGLYPPGAGTKLQIVDNKYYLPPFTNKTEDPERNFVFPNGHQIIPIKFDQKIMKDDCDGYKYQIDKNLQRQQAVYEEMNSTYWPFMKRMGQLFNLSGTITLSTMQSLHGLVQINQHLNRALPADFSDEDFLNLKHLDSFYKQFTWSYDLAKAANKYKFDKIIAMFDSRLKNPNQPLKWTFLSGHDLDIVPLYNDLNLSSSQCIEDLYRKGSTTAFNCEQVPVFATSLIFELYTEGSSHTIKIRSNGKYMNLCGTKSTECKYEDWKKLIQTNQASEELAVKICGNYKSVVNEGPTHFSFQMPQPPLPSMDNTLLLE